MIMIINVVEPSLHGIGPCLLALHNPFAKSAPESSIGLLHSTCVQLLLQLSVIVELMVSSEM
jgi:hypothetical protein